MDLLHETAGYVDSSDYEYQSYDLYSPKGASYKNDKKGLISTKYSIGSYNESKYGLNGGKANVYKKSPKGQGYTNNASRSNSWSSSNVSNLYINRVTNSKLNGDLYINSRGNANNETITAGWENTVDRTKAGLKSPRFGREDLTIKVDDTEKWVSASKGDNNTNKLVRANREMFNSIETVDSVTPMNEATNDVGSEFKWWCKSDGPNLSSVESPSLYNWESSLNAGDVVVVNSGNASVTSNKVNDAHQEVVSDGLVDQSDPVTVDTTDYQADGSLTSEFTEVLSEDNSDTKLGNTANDSNVSWKSWTVEGNELEELRARLVQKLLNKTTPTSDVSVDRANSDVGVDNGAVTLGGNCLDSGWDELSYYREMNKMLFEKLNLVLNGSSRLEYNLSYEYITSVQNHLLKVHQYINGHTEMPSSGDRTSAAAAKTANAAIPAKIGEITNKVEQVKGEHGPVKLEQVGDTTSPTTNLEVSPNESNTKSTETEDQVDKAWLEDYERLKQENEELKRTVSSLKLSQVATSSSTSVSQDKGKSPSVSAVEKDTTSEEDPEKVELLERLKVVQQSKDNLEEDFKKTLTYMRLMKDRLKMFKTNGPLHRQGGSVPVNGFNGVNARTVPVSNGCPGGYGHISNTQLKSVSGGQGVVNGHLTRANTAAVTSPINVTPPMGHYAKLNPISPPSNNVNSVERWNTTPISRNDTGFKKANSPENAKEGEIQRSNSCVRFKETSEMYIVPRSLSENKTILVNNTGNKLNRFFKIFSKT
ncbi:hypothetical protein MACK_002404 [Theileria orientalis]|uniref:Uncharacterized protein n=1 Tax=Theileria orientalis TaxID=68886 RepID=A0A976QUA7_THEOR|nr:hypothetical protein MACK_002404 [Theileria orientalis]